MIRLRWGTELQSYTYKADDDRKIIDVRVKARRVATADSESPYSFHTRKGLRVGDRRSRLQKLYPNADRSVHGNHVHYLLRESRYGKRLIAKVVEGRVVQLEAAPYEYC